MNLHDQIMNLRADESAFRGAEKIAFKMGHKEARHAAAEIASRASETISKLRTALQEAEAGLDFAVATIAKHAPKADWPESSPRKALNIARAALL